MAADKYYCKELNTTIYTNTIVLELVQKLKHREDMTKKELKHSSKTEDMRVFIVYDKDEELYYVFGSRKNEKLEKMCEFVKTFTETTHLYMFLDILMDFKTYTVDTYVHMMPYLTNNSSFNDFVKESKTKNNQISGYDDDKITMKQLDRYLATIWSE